MTTPRVSAHLPVYVPGKCTLAYGNRKLPKLNRELQSNDLSVRQQSLLLLTDVLHRRENLASALREGIPDTLKKLLEDDDPITKQRSSHVLMIIAQHALGRQVFLELKMITALSKLFSDSDFSVRFSAHRAVEMCARTNEGATGVVDAGMVPLCVEKLEQEEHPDMKCLILDTLHWCFQVDTTQGLQCKTIDTCVHLLSHESSKLRGRAARAIFDLTVLYDGKEMACCSENVLALVSLLSDLDPFVRAQAAGALMRYSRGANGSLVPRPSGLTTLGSSLAISSCSIAVITKGKYCVLEAEARPYLIALLDDEDSEVRLNSLKVLTLIAEAPEGRSELQSILPKLDKLIIRDNAMVTKAASTAKKVISWRP